MHPAETRRNVKVIATAENLKRVNLFINFAPKASPDAKFFRLGKPDVYDSRAGFVKFLSPVRKPTKKETVAST